MYDPHTRESRGFGFVTMESAEEAEAAIRTQSDFRDPPCKNPHHQSDQRPDAELMPSHWGRLVMLDESVIYCHLIGRARLGSRKTVIQTWRAKEDVKWIWSGEGLLGR